MSIITISTSDGQKAIPPPQIVSSGLAQGGWVRGRDMAG